HVVDGPQDLVIVEDPGAPRAGAEQAPRLIEHERVIARDPEVRRDIAEADLGTSREADAVRGTTAGLRRDLDHAVPGLRAVQRRRGRALHDLDALDVVRVDVRHAAHDQHAVHDIERFLAAARRVDRVYA